MATRKKLNNMYVADFETCDNIEKPSKFNTKDIDTLYQQKVWLAGIQNIETKQIRLFKDLDSFMLTILSRQYTNNNNIEIAFHNLKFDGSFIVPWLLNNGYLSTQHKPEKGEFSVLIDERNNWYSIRIQVTKKRRIDIWDTLKLFPKALEYLPETYSTPTKKIQEDSVFYETVRGDRHDPTPEEIKYITNDLQVLTETLEEHVKHYGTDFKKTQASQSFYNFTKKFKHWKRRFPPLDDKMDKIARKAYWGGISYVQQYLQGKDIGNLESYDINSSYPHQLANKKMPYGDILFITEDREPNPNHFWIADVFIKLKLKPYKIPCVPSKAKPNRIPGEPKWIIDSKGIIHITICSIDFETMQDSYDFEVIQWGYGYHWRQKKHKELAKFINENNDIKVNNKKKAQNEKDPVVKKELLASVQRAKIDNNSFYGKFGEEIIKFGKTPYLRNGNVIYVQDKEDKMSMHKRRFLPLAIATTAYGRQQLVLTGNKFGKDFIYCDTDSIYVISSEKTKDIVSTIEINSTKLGAWDKEGTYSFGRFLRQKCYMVEKIDTKKLSVTCAGLPADPHTGMGSKKRSCLSKDNFYIGKTVIGGNGKLRTVKTETGNKLIKTNFVIKEKAYV